MGNTFNPPIQLDPSMDKGHELAFINQNFQTLSTELESNSFRTVLGGTATISTPANSSVTYSIAHNLGFIPIPFCFLSANNNTQYIPLPAWTSLTRDDTTVISGTAGQIVFRTWINCYCDNTNLYIQHFNSKSSTDGPFDIKYYLLQRTAS